MCRAQAGSRSCLVHANTLLHIIWAKWIHVTEQDDYNTNIIPTLRNVVYPTWAALMNKHGYVEVPSGKHLEDLKQELIRGYWNKLHKHCERTQRYG